MDDPNSKRLSQAEKKLLEFINPIDAPDICASIESVLKMALMRQWNTLTEGQKDDIYVVNRIMSLSAEIAKINT